MASRGMVALAFLLALVAPGLAQDSHPAGRITATFYPAQEAAQRGKAAAALPDADKEVKPYRAPSMISPFKVDPGAPIHIEAASIVETSDGRAVFSGDVKLHQGDLLLRTRTLTAFYLGQFSVRNGDEWRAGLLTRVEAKDGVMVRSKGQTATGKWATFDLVGSTALLGGGVVVLTRVGEAPLKFNVAEGERFKVDLTTGILRFEVDTAPTSQQPASPTPRP
jgi:lipopolysaccharide export system protein LptA